MLRTVSDSQPVVRRGRFDCDGLDITYTTSQPAPTQWVALGLIPPDTGTMRTIGTIGTMGIETRPRILVGTGRTEAAALNSLRNRLAALVGGALSNA